MTPDQKVEALRLADALELEGEPRRSDKYAAADLLRALAAEQAPESLNETEIYDLYVKMSPSVRIDWFKKIAYAVLNLEHLRKEGINP